MLEFDQLQSQKTSQREPASSGNLGELASGEHLAVQNPGNTTAYTRLPSAEWTPAEQAQLEDLLLKLPQVSDAMSATLILTFVHRHELHLRLHL